MSSKGARFQKSRILLILVLCLLLTCEITVCLAVIGAGRYSIKYKVRYDISPLQLKRVEIINREDLREQYRILDTQRLYEVCFTYENIADFTSTYLRFPDLETYISEDKVFLVHPENHPEVFSEIIFNQVVPVGKTGNIVCYIAVDENEPYVVIREKDDKLAGKGETMELWLPAGQGETFSWNAED